MSKSFNLLLIFVIVCGVGLLNLPHCLAATGEENYRKYFSSIIFTLKLNLNFLTNFYFTACRLLGLPLPVSICQKECKVTGTPFATCNSGLSCCAE